ncbi:MAG: hypoxanthine phosphoribosyltransferase [Acidimicrobiia bacterium]|nr:hypoxanthine phosphoribosyltransferase [Acidimicrobiia bacterium]
MSEAHGETVTEVITSESLSERIGALADAVNKDYQGRTPILVSVLKGTLPFIADLGRRLTIPVEFDFLQLTRFGEGGRIGIALDTGDSLTHRDVILVEDIVDTGLSLQTLHQILAERHVSSLSTVTLLDKVPRRLVDVPLEYRGFEVGDEYLVGYGLDWQGKFRNLPGIWAILDRPAFERDLTGQFAYMYG